MLKVAVVHNAYQHSGGEDSVVRNEIAALQGAGVHVQSFIRRSSQDLSAKLRALGAPLGLGYESSLEKFCAEQKPDILHVHNLFPLFSPRIFSIAHENDIKTVLTLHNYRPLCLNGLFMTPQHEVCERCADAKNYRPGIARACYRESKLQSAGLAAHLQMAAYQEWYNHVDLFIAPSRFLRNKFVANAWPADKIVVQGHFLPDFPVEEPVPADSYILFLGRLSEEKGLRWLLEQFRQPRLPIDLVVAGSGPLEGLVRENQSAHIRYVGHVADRVKEDILKKATCLVMSSECYENFPLVVPEANSFGVPALVVDLLRRPHPKL